MADTPVRPSLESIEDRESYNRIRLPAALRDKVMIDIDAFNDSSESLPIPSEDDSDYPDENASQRGISTTQATSATNNMNPFPGPKKAATGKSTLSNVVQSSDIPTPVAPKADPLAEEGAKLKNKTTNDDVTPTQSRSGSHSPGNGVMSKVSTQEDAEDKKRPGTLRRLTTKLKRTISSRS